MKIWLWKCKYVHIYIHLCNVFANSNVPGYAYILCTLALSSSLLALIVHYIHEHSPLYKQNVYISYKPIYILFVAYIYLLYIIGKYKHEGYRLRCNISANKSHNASKSISNRIESRKYVRKKISLRDSSKGILHVYTFGSLFSSTFVFLRSCAIVSFRSSLDWHVFSSLENQKRRIAG